MNSFNYKFSQFLRAFFSIVASFFLLLTISCGGGSPSEKTTFTVDDSGGTNNSSPVVTILTPNNSAQFHEADQLTFTASASDEEDGDISADIIWYSDISGEIGRGSSFVASLESANHKITAEVTDSSGTVERDEIDLSILSSNGVAFLSWTAPTENTDESVLYNLSGYKVYYGLDVNNLDNIITVNNPEQLNLEINRLNVGETYYFTITAYNSYDVESEFSMVVSKEI